MHTGAAIALVFARWRERCACICQTRYR